MNENSLPIGLFLVGGGGHAISCAEVISRVTSYKLIGFTDNNKNAPLSKFGYRHLGDDTQLEYLVENGYSAAVGIGQIRSADKRKKIHNILLNFGANLPVITAVTSYVSLSATIGDGTLLFHNSVVNIGAKIGQCCIINTSAVIEHGCKIGHHSHIAPNVTLLGDAIVGDCCFIGAGSIIFPGVKIEDYSIIPAGSIIK